MKFPIIRQYDAVDCGPASLKMIAEYYGKNYSLDKLRDRSNITRLGVSIKKYLFQLFLGMSREVEIIIKDIRLIKQIFYKIVNFFS